ncbi:MAG: hypothetical protein GWN29_12860, partial [Gammaproteobacteria bacterium]|nr:hypothetical protein [Gammaproteobacteria bacterium]
MRSQESLSVFYLGALAMMPAYAHHAASASFDVAEHVVLEGYVNEFIFKNPHVNIIFTVTDDDGVETQWMATAPATAPMRRWGWTADTVQEGQYLRMEGHPRRDGGPMILIEGQAFREGRDTVFEIDPTDGSVIRTLGMSRVERRVADSLPQTLGDGRPNLTGTWLGSSPGSARRTQPPLNEAG